MYQVRTKDFGEVIRVYEAETLEKAALLFLAHTGPTIVSSGIYEMFSDDSARLIVEISRILPGQPFKFTMVLNIF